MSEGIPNLDDPGYISPEFHAQIEGAVYGIDVSGGDVWTRYMRGEGAVGQHDEPPIPPDEDVRDLHDLGQQGMGYHPN